MTYLDGGYLEDDAPGQTIVVQAPAQTPATQDMITLPGGITIPKKTFIFIMLGLAAVLIYLYSKKKGKKGR